MRWRITLLPITNTWMCEGNGINDFNRICEIWVLTERIISGITKQCKLLLWNCVLLLGYVNEMWCFIIILQPAYFLWEHMCQEFICQGLCVYCWCQVLAFIKELVKYWLSENIVLSIEVWVAAFLLDYMKMCKCTFHNKKCNIHCRAYLSYQTIMLRPYHSWRSMGARLVYYLWASDKERI